jgi:hypothetical protein
MRDFELLQAICRGNEVHEQARVSTIYGRAEDRDFTRGGPAQGDSERGMSTPRLIALGAVPLAGGGLGWFGGGAEARCPVRAA